MINTLGQIGACSGFTCPWLCRNPDNCTPLNPSRPDPLKGLPKTNKVSNRGIRLSGRLLGGQYNCLIKTALKFTNQVTNLGLVNLSGSVPQFLPKIPFLPRRNALGIPLADYLICLFLLESKTLDKCASHPEGKITPTRSAYSTINLLQIEPSQIGIGLLFPVLMVLI